MFIYFVKSYDSDLLTIYRIVRVLIRDFEPATKMSSYHVLRIPKRSCSNFSLKAFLAVFLLFSIKPDDPTSPISAASAVSLSLSEFKFVIENHPRFTDYNRDIFLTHVKAIQDELIDECRIRYEERGRPYGNIDTILPTYKSQKLRWYLSSGKNLGVLNLLFDYHVSDRGNINHGYGPAYDRFLFDSWYFKGEREFFDESDLEIERIVAENENYNFEKQDSTKRETSKKAETDDSKVINDYSQILSHSKTRHKHRCDVRNIAEVGIGPVSWDTDLQSLWIQPWITNEKNRTDTEGVNYRYHCGAGLRVWRDFYPNADIYGFDVMRASVESSYEFRWAGYGDRNPLSDKLRMTDESGKIGISEYEKNLFLKERVHTYLLNGFNFTEVDRFMRLEI